MKKTILMVALALVGVCCYAQKANVKKAKNLVLQETPDFAAAKAAIDEALVNDETKGQAETWYVAGLIGYTQNDQMNISAMMGQAVDDNAKGQGIMESFDYWVKADEIAMTPVVDKKGKEKVDTKMRKTISAKMMDYYNNQDFIKYGIYLNEQKDYANAYKAFIRHLSIQDLPMMQDPKLQEKMPKDTIYDQYKYYAAIFAIQAEMHDEAIAILTEMKDGEYEAVTVNQFLYQEYVAVKDTANFLKVLQDAIARFPKEPWFLQNLINFYIFSDQTDQAIVYLDQAIEREPEVAQYHLIKGNIIANDARYDEAKVEYEKALEVDPTLADAMAGCGRIYYNQAVKMNEEAAYIADAKAYKKALTEMNEMFKKSLPYFEKAHEMEPENRDYMITLRTLYYRFEMDKEYNAISEELNK